MLARLRHRRMESGSSHCVAGQPKTLSSSGWFVSRCRVTRTETVLGYTEYFLLIWGNEMYIAAMVTIVCIGDSVCIVDCGFKYSRVSFLEKEVLELTRREKTNMWKAL